VNAWHTLTDSDAFRWFAKRGPGRPVLRSRAFRTLDLARNYARSSYAARRDGNRFDGVRTFCFFVGHNKSGTSLLGGLLDAHEDIVLADEIDALRYVDAGFGRDQIFYLLARGANAEARKGRVTARRLEPYSYLVPGQWQGRTVRPVVCGDSTSGSSTRRLGENPGLLDRLGRIMPGVHVRIIQVIRNPFDPISAMMVRGGRSFENAIDHYFTACETLVRLRRRVAADTLLPIRYEDVVADPERRLASACGFLGVNADTRYLAACAAIVRRRPDRSRDMVRWTQPWIDVVERRAASVDFLEGYAYGA
jgi:hypothetical protein